MDAAEAERAGLVSRVVAADKLIEESLSAARQIAAISLPAAMLTKESVNRSYETSSPKAYASSDGYSIPYLRRTTRRRAWRPLLRNGRLAFGTGER